MSEAVPYFKKILTNGAHIQFCHGEKYPSKLPRATEGCSNWIIWSNHNFSSEAKLDFLKQTFENGPHIKSAFPAYKLDVLKRSIWSSHHTTLLCGKNWYEVNFQKLLTREYLTSKGLWPPLCLSKPEMSVASIIFSSSRRNEWIKEDAATAAHCTLD